MKPEPKKFTATIFVSREMIAPEEYWTRIECDKRPGQGKHFRSRHRDGFVAPCWECAREDRVVLALAIAGWLEDNPTKRDGYSTVVRHIFELHVADDYSDLSSPQCQECSAYDHEGLSGCEWPCPTLQGVVDAILSDRGRTNGE